MCHKCKCKKSQSLVCPEKQAKIAQRILKSVVGEPVVTRDAYNNLTIEGGNWFDMNKTAGYESGRDRLLQQYGNIIRNSGQLASLIGSDGIFNDVNIRSNFPSFQEVIDQWNLYKSPVDPTEHYLEGFNAYIQDVIDGNQPLPAEFQILGLLPEPIELGEFLLSNLVNLNDVTGSEGGFIENIFYFNLLESLVVDSGYDLETAKLISKDLYNTRLKRFGGIAAKTTDTNVIQCDDYVPRSARSVKSVRSVRSVSVKSVVKSPSVKTPTIKTQTIKDYIKYREDMEKLHEENNIPIRKRGVGASYGYSISGKLTESGKPMGIYGPQLELTNIPGAYTNVTLKNNELGFNITIPSVTGNTITQTLGSFSNLGYTYSVSSQVGSVPGKPALLQNPSEDIYVRTDTIDVRFAGQIQFDVYASPHLGYVQQFWDGVSVQKFIFTSPLFEGEKSIVKRNLDFGREIEYISAAQNMYFATSLEEVRDTIRGPGWTTSINQMAMGHDNQCNYWAAERGGWYDFETSDFIPQGVLDNPIPPSNSVERRSGTFINRPKKGFATCWNGAITQELPSIYGDSSTSRVVAMDEIIKRFTKDGRKIKSSDIKSILAQTGNQVQGAIPIEDWKAQGLVGQNYNADVFHFAFKNRFAQAVASNPTPDRVAAVALLEDFDGGFIDGDDFAIVNSLDVSDKWLLAQQWTWNVQAVVFESTLLDTWLVYRGTSNKRNSNFSDYARKILAMLSRLLGTEPVSNQVFYPDWIANLPTDIDTIIVEALDTALVNLGGLNARPWGENKRPTATYSNAVFGPMSFTCDNPPIANRAATYFVTEMTSRHNMDVSGVLQIGQSGLILFNEQGQPVVQDDLQMCDYVKFNPIKLNVMKGKKKCHKKNRCKNRCKNRHY